MDFKDAVKTKNIIKIKPDATLSSALSQLSSSHDSAFVFSDDNKFLGVINPYHALIKTSYPGNAKVEHCLFHPPKVRNNFSVSKVAQLFIESKLHYLPIFDDRDKFVGIGSARHLLSIYRNSTRFNIPLSDFLKTKNQPLLTIYETDVISNALNIFKSRKVSKLVVVNKDMKLRGVLTYYDLISFLVVPKRKGHKGDRAGTQVSFQNQAVRNFAKSNVLTLTPQGTLHEALQLILDKQIGSVVVVDDKKTPLGIITTRDFLSLLIRGKQEKKIEISGKDLSDESRHVLGGFFNTLTHWSRRLPQFDQIKLFVREEKKGGVFDAMLSLIPRRGPAHVIKKQGKNLQKLLQTFKAGKK